VLERHGWLVAVAAQDGRRRLLALSPSGHKKLEEALPAWQEAQEIVDRQLAAQQLSAR
jgi:DNA-binding PadR family transcriptional regulator